MPRTIRALALCCLIPALQGCLIVVDSDHEHEAYSTSDDTYHRGRIGVYLESVEGSTASQLGLDRSRTTLVTSVVEGSSAEKAGLKKYDIITAVDGDAEASPSRVRRAIREHKAGEQVSFSILRQGKPDTVSVPVQ